MGITQKYFRNHGSIFLNKILTSEVELPLEDGTVYPAHKGEKFYYFSDGVYIGVDNTDGQCFVEEFDTLSECISWLTEYDS